MTTTWHYWVAYTFTYPSTGGKGTGNGGTEILRQSPIRHGDDVLAIRGLLQDLDSNPPLQDVVISTWTLLRVEP